MGGALDSDTSMNTTLSVATTNETTSTFRVVVTYRGSGVEIAKTLPDVNVGTKTIDVFLSVAEKGLVKFNFLEVFERITLSWHQVIIRNVHLLMTSIVRNIVLADVFNNVFPGPVGQRVECLLLFFPYRQSNTSVTLIGTTSSNGNLLFEIGKGLH
eukprot:Lithocolla_globosa_v1_NODE_3922_length_1550_cov_15.142475.p2 type:complete len:156 gc:universal NODE_3922_length_1550_cov_15.142475:747-1214(+)